MAKVKLYRVSLAVLVQQNWETDIKAKSANEAFKKATELFEDDITEGELVDVDGCDIQLDLSDPDDPKDPWNPNKTSGVYVEELK